MIIMWEIVMIFKMSYSVFVLFTGIGPTQAPPFIPHLRGGVFWREKIKEKGLPRQQQCRAAIPYVWIWWSIGGSNP